MKILTTLSLCLCCVIDIYAQDLIGAWEASAVKDGRALKNMVIFSNSYQVSTWYDAETGAFVSSNGGKWKLEGNMIIETVEFDTENSDRVGTEISFEIELTKNELRAKGSDKAWARVDSGKPGNLAGAWLISGRMRNGEIQSRSTDRPRKTMKILSGTRFQWIAYNTETKQFMGTGGGTYTTKKGKYTENIEFFSRDDSRVGASLEFNYELKDGAWHHSGNNSRGEPMYEIWSVRVE